MEQRAPDPAQLLAMHAVIAAAAGSPLPLGLKEQLDAASLAVGEPNSTAPLDHLAQKEGRLDWRQRLGRHLGHTLEGLAIANYHVERVGEIETELAQMVASLQDPPRSSSVGFGSRKLNAEYQAFVFALRRAVEYFSAAVGAFFKTDCRRIKDAPSAISGREPRERSSVAITAIEAGLSRIPGLLTSEAAQSTRDRMAHAEFVDAGTYNAVWDASGNLSVQALVGGGEELPHFPDPSVTLSATLRTQFHAVCAMVLETYTIFGLLSAEHRDATTDE